MGALLRTSQDHNTAQSTTFQPITKHQHGFALAGFFSAHKAYQEPGSNSQIGIWWDGSKSTPVKQCLKSSKVLTTANNIFNTNFPLQCLHLPWIMKLLWPKKNSWMKTIWPRSMCIITVCSSWRKYLLCLCGLHEVTLWLSPKSIHHWPTFYRRQRTS